MKTESFFSKIRNKPRILVLLSIILEVLPKVIRQEEIKAAKLKRKTAK